MRFAPTCNRRLKKMHNIVVSILIDLKKKSPNANCVQTQSGAGDRTRTGTVLLPRDFKSRASASSATPARYDTQQLLRISYYIPNITTCQPKQVLCLYIFCFFHRSEQIVRTACSCLLRRISACADPETGNYAHNIQSLYR